jgi:hypothetical protein
MFKNFVKNLFKKIQSKKFIKKIKTWLPEVIHMTKIICFWGITVSPKIGIL